MTGYEYLIMLLAFSILLNVCYIGLRIYDHIAERKLQRELDKLRHPSYRSQHPDAWLRGVRHPVYMGDWVFDPVDRKWKHRESS
jgi:hypothetical protein